MGALHFTFWAALTAFVVRTRFGVYPTVTATCGTGLLVISPFPLGIVTGFGATKEFLYLLCAITPRTLGNAAFADGVGTLAFFANGSLAATHVAVTKAVHTLWAINSDFFHVSLFDVARFSR